MLGLLDIFALLLPPVGVLRKSGALNPYDAEPLTGRRLHHHPALQAVHHLGAQLLQAHHFGRDVIGLDVYVDPALVVHALDLHDRLIRWGLQHEVIAATARMLGINGATQRLAPEAISAVLQSISMAHRREWCIFESS
jgi:hypothetical protein